MASMREAFLAAVDEPTRRQLEALTDLDERLVALIATAQAAWPEVELGRDAFVAHLAKHLRTDVPATEAFDQLQVTDLYLACACAAGDARAAESFRTSYLPIIRAVLARLDAANMGDDVAQEVLTKLITRDERGRARVSQYSGRGKLAAWVRVATTRLAWRLLAKEGRHEHRAGDALFERLTAVEDPELQYLKQLYREQFTRALARAFESLTSRQRNILRYDLLDGLNIDEIGTIYGVHRATVARWRVACRQQLFAATKRLVNEELALDTREFRSMVQLIRSQIELDLGQVIGEAERPDDTEPPSAK